MIRVTYEFQCGLCGAKQSETIEMANREDPPKPRPPQGWKYVDALLVCPKHELQIREGTHWIPLDPGETI